LDFEELMITRDLNNIWKYWYILPNSAIEGLRRRINIAWAYIFDLIHASMVMLNKANILWPRWDYKEYDQ